MSALWIGDRFLGIDLGESEIEDLRFAVCSELDVGRFEISVDDPSFVGRLQGGCHFDGDADGFADRQGSSGDALGLGSELGRQQLQRDLAVEPLVERSVHLTHPSLTELGCDPEVGERSTDHGSKSCPAGAIVRPLSGKTA